MAPPSKNVNLKKEAGNAKKAETEARKKAEVEKQREAAEAAAWNQGANTKRAERSELEAQQADEAARKKREKQALLEAEEAALAGGSGKKASGGAAAKQAKKNKKKDDLSMLEDALVTAADKKAKQKKEELEQRKRQEEESHRRKEEQKAAVSASLDPLLANTEQMLGGVLITDSEDGTDMGRKGNVARMEAEGASGIDAALGAVSTVLNVHGQPLKSAKALYNDYEARMLPIMKEEHPGLRLAQYKEKIWASWKKSPDNPANVLPPP
jgi:Coiled-coil domain-containing protein 124 /Oxs1